ncbi:MAG: flagellar basal body-associated protein FliL [Actinomycetota bacterium]
MATKQTQADADTRKGVMLVVALVVGAMVVGAAIHYFWQRYAGPQKPRPVESRYLSLGEQAMGIGNHSILIHFTLEYVGSDTEESLKKVMPKLKSQVTNRMSQIQTSDLGKLRTPQGKKELANDMRTLVRDALPEEDAKNVKGVLYEKFLIGE